MTMQFGGGGGGASLTTANTWTAQQTFSVPPFASAAPTAGKPTLQIGTGTFAGGATPDFQNTATLGINMPSGYAQYLIDAQIAGASRFRVDTNGSIFMSGNATLYTNNLISSGNNLQLIPDSATHSIIVAERSFHTQTADIFKINDGNAVNHWGVANVGTAVAPIWAMRVAPVANTSSMAQAHVGGASTGKAIQVIDNAGTTIGWLQLLA